MLAKPFAKKGILNEAPFFHENAFNLKYFGRGLLHEATCYIIMKFLALTVWDKTIFKDFLHYLYVKSVTPQYRVNCHNRAIEVFW